MYFHQKQGIISISKKRVEKGILHYFFSKGESIDKNLYSHSGFGGSMREETPFQTQLAETGGKKPAAAR